MDFLISCLDLIKEIYSFINNNGVLVSLITLAYTLRIDRRVKDRFAAMRADINGIPLDICEDRDLVYLAQVAKPNTGSVIGTFDKNLKTEFDVKTGQVHFYSEILKNKLASEMSKKDYVDALYE